MSSATGGRISLCVSKGSTSCASGGPSTSTISGCSFSNALRKLRAHPGPWWRTPKMWVLTLKHLLAGPIQVFPAITFFDHGLQVFKPDNVVLYRVLNNGTCET